MRLKRKKHQPARLATACLGLLAALAVVQEVQGQVFLPAGTTNWTGTQNYAGQNVYVGYGNTATLNANAATVTSGVVHVGFNGNGTVNLLNGTAWTSDYVRLGINASDIGAVTVDGTGSQLNAVSGYAQLFIGEDGSGSLAVQNGGHASGLYLFAATYSSNSMGAVSVDGTGSALDVYAASIGRGGIGSLAITNGGVATVGGEGLKFGELVGSNGTGTVDGVGSTILVQSGGSLSVGRGGSGHLDITNGGTVTVTNNRIIEIGSSASGSVHVDGSGAVLEATGGQGQAFIGLSGAGSLEITNGGLTTAGSTVVGYSSIATGEVTVDGLGSTLQATNYANYVGYYGSGTLNVTNGGLAIAPDNRIGDSSTGVGIVNVSGVGSTLQANSTNSIGYQGTGTLNLQTGGVATAPNTYVAERAGSHGTVNIDGPGASLQTTNLYVGGSNAGAGGVGQITVDHGGSILINAGGVAQIWSTGSLDLHDGTLINNGTFNNAGTLTLGPGAVLAGSGVYNGSLTIADGTTLAPGNSPGTMTFNGNQTWGDGGNLDLQLLNTAGTAGVDWDKILINGVLNLTATSADPFIINLATLSDSSTAGFLAGFDPFSSYQWLFLTASSITGFDANAFEVNTADFWNVFSNGTFGVHQDGGSLYLDYHAAFVPPPTDGTVTPEPTSLALAGFAGLGMAVGAWRRRRLQKSQAA